MNNTHEAIGLLQDYLRIDTTNPPGRELAAARFLAGILEREGIPCTIHESGPERANLVARFEGTGEKRPIMLLNHMDVVGVEPDKWSVDPFAGELRDGCIWGRGVLDMKGMGIQQLMALINLKRAGRRLSRDIIFVAVADEEQGGGYGARWMVEHHAAELDCEYIINEGSFGIGDIKGLKAPLFPCSSAEKGPLWLHIRCDGQSGHGSMPPATADHATHKLLAGLDRLQRRRKRLVLNPEVQALAAAVGDHLPVPGLGWFCRHLDHPLVWPWASRLFFRSPQAAAMVCNTQSINVLRAGSKDNVVPSEAEAVVDFRLLPGVDPEVFLTRIRRILRIKGAHLETSLKDAASRSTTDTELWDVMDKVIKRHYPGAIFTPSLSSGFTDSRFFRNLGATAYGLMPVLIAPELISTVHGHDERVEIKTYLEGIDILTEVLEIMGA